MRLRDEYRDPNSCFNRAKPDELLFVLLGRDQAAPATIRFWVSTRVAMGKNNPIDPQIKDALDIADEMEREQACRPSGANPAS